MQGIEAHDRRCRQLFVRVERPGRLELFAKTLLERLEPWRDEVVLAVDGVLKAVWRQLGVGVSRLSRSETVGLSGQLPHPFRFDRPRAVDGTEAGVAREETAIHVHARWGIPVSQSVEVALFGGPTFFSVSQAFVTGIDFDQAYPYDTATLTTAMTRTQDGSTIGFNVGADVSVYFSRWVGVGGLIRFSRSEVDLGDRPTTIAVGGLHTAAGLRLRF